MAERLWFHDPAQGLTVPNPRSERLAEIEWQLRYGEGALSREDRMLAASVIEGFRELAMGTHRQTHQLKRLARKGEAAGAGGEEGR